MAEAKPGGGFFAVAGLAIPGVRGMAPGVPDLPAEWTMPTAPTVPLGMVPVEGGVPADVIPRTVFDGLGLSCDEHLTWAQPLLLIAIAMEGLLGSSCSSYRRCSWGVRFARHRLASHWCSNSNMRLTWLYSIRLQDRNALYFKKLGVPTF